MALKGAPAAWIFPFKKFISFYFGLFMGLHFLPRQISALRHARQVWWVQLYCLQVHSTTNIRQIHVSGVTSMAYGMIDTILWNSIWALVRERFRFNLYIMFSTSVFVREVIFIWPVILRSFVSTAPLLPFLHFYPWIQQSSMISISSFFVTARSVTVPAVTFLSLDIILVSVRKVEMRLLSWNSEAVSLGMDCFILHFIGISLSVVHLVPWCFMVACLSHCRCNRLNFQCFSVMAP